jgi:hypothetical protein
MLRAIALVRQVVHDPDARHVRPPPSATGAQPGPSTLHPGTAANSRRATGRRRQQPGGCGGPVKVRRRRSRVRHSGVWCLGVHRTGDGSPALPCGGEAGDEGSSTPRGSSRTDGAGRLSALSPSGQVGGQVGVVPTPDPSTCSAVPDRGVGAGQGAALPERWWAPPEERDRPGGEAARITGEWRPGGSSGTRRPREDPHRRSPGAPAPWVAWAPLRGWIQRLVGGGVVSRGTRPLSRLMPSGFQAGRRPRGMRR